MTSQASISSKAHASSCMTDPSLPLQLVPCPQWQSVSMLSQHQFVCNSPSYILLPLCLCSYIAHFWNSFPSLSLFFFNLVNFHPSFKIFPRGILWYHFPSLPFSGQIRCTFSVLPQYTAHTLVRASVGWFSGYPWVPVLSLCAQMVFHQFFLYPHAWLVSNR